MSVVLTGFEELVASLQNTAERSSRGAREELVKGAYKIKNLAELYAPVDKGNLEKAIKVGEEIGVNRRKAYFVFVDETLPAGDGKTVGDYATEMHEGTYKLGKDSEKKQQSNPGIVVGRKYLERAMLDLDDEIKAAVESKVNQGVGH